MKCENCGKEHDGSYGSGRFCSRHCRCSFNAKKVKNRHSNQLGKHKTSPYGTWHCDRCNLIFRTKAQLLEHNHECHPIQKGHAWNYGLSKETDERVAKRAQILKDNYKSGKIVCHNKGKPMSDEQKKKTSESCKRFYKEHPELVPYKLHHSSKESYPEKYFRELLINENITGWKQDFYIEGYFLDFGFERKKIDLEVDGSQHWLDPKIIEHDKIRTQKLISLGWTVIRIRWDDWQKMSIEQKEKLVNDIRNMV